MSGLKTIDTGGIGWLDELGDGLYWGMDYTSGDLYEAFDLYRDGHRINKNRLIFVRYPEGAVFEPVKAEDGQYLGRLRRHILHRDLQTVGVIFLRGKQREHIPRLRNGHVQRC